MTSNPPHVLPEQQRRLQEDLTDICFQLPKAIRTRSIAEAKGKTTAAALGDLCAAHPEFERARTHETTRWAGMIVLTIVAWLCDFLLVASFSSFIVGLFVGGAR
jgi:hypothetical protein